MGGGRRGGCAGRRKRTIKPKGVAGPGLSNCCMEMVVITIYGGFPGLKLIGKLTAVTFFLLNNLIFPFKEEISTPTWLRSLEVW